MTVCRQHAMTSAPFIIHHDDIHCRVDCVGSERVPVDVFEADQGGYLVGLHDDAAIWPTRGFAEAVAAAARPRGPPRN